MKILHVEPKRYEAELRLRIRTVGAVDFRDCEHQAAFLATLAGERYEALFFRLGIACDVTAFDLAPKLRYVVTPTTGTDHIDLDEARQRNVKIISLRGEDEFLDSVTSTAEHAWMLLLALCRQLRPASADVLAGRWRREPFIARELYGRTLGILGCGRLGRMMARYGQAFGMQVLAYDVETSQIDRAAGVESVRLNHLLARSDFLSVHLPLDDNTVGFLNRERIAWMKPGAFLINTARGELIDEDALLEALKAGTLGGVALDVLFGDATWDRDSPLRQPLIAYAKKNPNLIITPHTGGYGIDALQRTREFIVEKFLAAVERESGDKA